MQKIYTEVDPFTLSAQLAPITNQIDKLLKFSYPVRQARFRNSQEPKGQRFQDKRVTRVSGCEFLTSPLRLIIFFP